MNLLKDSFFIKRPTKSNLKKNGFKYDMYYSTKDCECYKYIFSVDTYDKIPVMICAIRVYMDNGEVLIDVYNNSGDIYSAWYQRNNRVYTHYKEYIRKIDKKIFDKMKKLNIIKK